MGHLELLTDMKLDSNGQIILNETQKEYILREALTMLGFKHIDELKILLSEREAAFLMSLKLSQQLKEKK